MAVLTVVLFDDRRSTRPHRSRVPRQGRNGDVTALRRCYGFPRTHQVGRQVSDALRARCEARPLPEPSAARAASCRSARRRRLRGDAGCVRAVRARGRARRPARTAQRARRPPCRDACAPTAYRGSPIRSLGPAGRWVCPLTEAPDGSLTAEGTDLRRTGAAVSRAGVQGISAAGRWPVATGQRRTATSGAGVRALHARTRCFELPRPDVLGRRPGWTTGRDKPAVARVSVRYPRVRCWRRRQHRDRRLSMHGRSDTPLGQKRQAEQAISIPERHLGSYSPRQPGGARSSAVGIRSRWQRPAVQQSGLQ